MAEGAVDGAMTLSVNDIGHVASTRTVAKFVENDAFREDLEVPGGGCANGQAVRNPSSSRCVRR
jgi:hypothetical protein